jgi:hypothetical protein
VNREWVGVLAGHVGAISATVLLAGIWVALGGRILRTLAQGVDTWPSPLPLATALVLGQGAVSVGMLGLGAAGALHPVVVIGLCLLIVIALHRDLVALAGQGRRLLSAWPADALSRTAVGAWILLAIMAAVLALAPPWEWDTLMYHQAIPLEFLRLGTIHLPVDNFQVALVGVAQLASLPLLALGLEAGPALASVLSFLFLPVGVLALARVVGAGDAGWWSVLLLAGVPSFLLVATTARIDVTLVTSLVVAHAVLLLAATRGDTGLFWTAAAAFGVAGGMKLHGLAYAGLCAPIAWQFMKQRRCTLVALAVFVMAIGPWLGKNALLLGAPFHPVGAEAQLEPWLAEIAGSTAIPAGFDTSSLSQLAGSRASFSLIAAFLDPARLTIEGEGQYYGLPLVLLLLPVAAFAIRRQPVLAALLLPPLAYLAAVLLPFERTNLRYLFPAIPVLVLGTVIGLRALSPRLPLLGRRLLLLSVAVGVGMTVADPLAERVGPRGLLIRWAAGLESRDSVRAQLSDAGARQFAQLEAAVAGLPDDSLVLLLWEARTAGLPVRLLADVRLSNWPLLSQTPAPASCLAGTGITHLVVNQGGLRYYLARGASAEAFRLGELEVFLANCLQEVHHEGSYLVGRLNSGGANAVGSGGG